MHKQCSCQKIERGSPSLVQRSTALRMRTAVPNGRGNEHSCGGSVNRQQQHRYLWRLIETYVVLYLGAFESLFSLSCKKNYSGLLALWINPWKGICRGHMPYDKRLYNWCVWACHDRSASFQAKPRMKLKSSYLISRRARPRSLLGTLQPTFKLCTVHFKLFLSNCFYRDYCYFPYTFLVCIEKCSILIHPYMCLFSFRKLFSDLY